MSEITQLPTNLVDDELSQSMGGLRRYEMIQNSDGTVSFRDVSTYSTVGSNYGAEQINAQNEVINQQSQHLTELQGKVGNGMKCVKYGKVSVGTTGTAIDVSEFNFTSEEDYFIIYDSTLYATAFIAIEISAKTTTSITLKKSSGNAADVCYQIIALR